MAGPLDLRGRAVISDVATGTLNAIKGRLDAIGASAKRISTGQYLGNVAHSIQRHSAQIAGATTAAGLGIRSIIDSTRDFNESKFGYGFARLTDHIKDGRLDVGAWRKDMDGMARSVIATSKQFGSLPAVTMKAREEVEKLGFKGDEAQSIFGAALALHLSEPTALASGEAAKYMGAVYRAYEKQRNELAQRLGQDANDPKFKEAYIKGLAGKAAVAGAESALGPADIVEGMRQFAPQWAAMGVDYEFALAMLGHGSNFGFRAPELGTAFKSMMTKVINPTADGLKTLNLLGIDRSQFMTSAPVEPVKAAGRINTLLSGALGGKGWRERKMQLSEMLETAYKQGVTGTPEFQEALTQEVLRMLPKGYEGKSDEVMQAVQNATITGQGGVKLPEMIQKMRDQGATVGQIATFFEGRHVARYTPMFQFYEKLIDLHDKIKKTGPEVIDETVKARKESEAGKTDQMYGAWQRLMLALEQTGPVDMAKTAITALFDAIAKLPKDVLAIGSGLAAVAAGIVAIGVAAKSLAWLTGIGSGAAGAGAAGGAGAGAGAGAAAGATAAGGAGLMSRLSGWGGRLLKGASGLSMLYGLIEMRRMADDYANQQWQDIYAKRGQKPPSFSLFGSSAEAAGGGASPLPGPMPGGAWEQDGAAAGPAASQGQMHAAVQAAQDASQQITATFQQIDLTGEGQRIGESLAAGLRSGLASAVAAVEDAGAQISAAASRINLNTGPAMQGAR